MASIPFKLLMNQVSSYFQAIESQEVVIGGHRSRYLEAGVENKPALVFLHGLGGSKAQWRNMMVAFAEDYRVIAPDVPGLCIHSPLRDSHHTLKQLMSWLDRFLSELQINEVHIIAHSTACPLAAVYAGGRDFVLSTALICFPDVLAARMTGKGEAYRQYRERINFESMEDWDRFFSEAFYQPIKVPNAIKRYNFNKFMQHHDTFTSVVDDLVQHQSLVMPNLKRFKGAALVLNADHDNFADEAFHKVLEAHLPQAKHQLIKRCGHMAFIDRYELVVEALKGFFADIAAKRLSMS